jgi:membrane-associated phospholipid phosphatase
MRIHDTRWKGFSGMEHIGEADQARPPGYERIDAKDVFPMCLVFLRLPRGVRKPKRLAILSLAFLLLPVGSFGAAEDPPTPPGQQDDKRDLIYYPDDVESVVPLARKLAGNVWLDQKAIWTSPFHMNRDNVALWAGFGALTAVTIATDRQTIHIFENSAGQIRWGNHISNVGSVYTLVPAVAGFYVGGILIDNQKARETGVLGAEALLDSFIVVEVLKTAAGRNRPNAADRPGDFFQGGASFPSGHSIASWTLASVIAHEYSNHKWVPWVAYGFAGAVGAARVGSLHHYPSDVIAASAIGFFVGRYVVDTHQAHAGHRHHAALAPLAFPSTGTYGLSVTLQP